MVDNYRSGTSGGAESIKLQFEPLAHSLHSPVDHAAVIDNTTEQWACVSPYIKVGYHRLTETLYMFLK
jgi:hypothetical protein